MNNIQNVNSQTSARNLALRNFNNLKHYDFRIVRRVISTATSMYQSIEVRFSKIFNNPAEKKAAYRLIENNNLESQALLGSITESSFSRMREKDLTRIIVPQDTTDYTRKPFEKVEGLETLGNKYSIGLLLHSALWVSYDGIPEGLISAEMYKHKLHKKTGIKSKDKNIHRNIPVEEKESYRWLKVVDNVNKQLPSGVKAIFTADREGDFYEYLQRLYETKSSHVTRHCHNRNVIGPNGKIGKVRDFISDAPVQACQNMQIPTKRNKFENVRMTVKWLQITLLPQKNGRKNYVDREPFSLGCVNISGKLKNGTEINWTLYTDLPLKSSKDALEIVRIYKVRWRIEEFHLILKSGMGIEKIKLQYAENIKRFIALCIPRAVQILKLRYLAEMSPKTSATEILGANEIKALKQMLKKYRGIKQRKINVKECVEYIAFIGGWMGRKGDGPPGVRTIWRGLKDVAFLAEFM